MQSAFLSGSNDLTVVWYLLAPAPAGSDGNMSPGLTPKGLFLFHCCAGLQESAEPWHKFLKRILSNQSNSHQSHIKDPLYSSEYKQLNINSAGWPLIIGKTIVLNI